MEFKSNLHRRIWCTKSSRFNAHNRLLRLGILESISIAFLSMYVIIANIIIFIPGLSIKQGRDVFITLFSIIVSIFILILSLLLTNRNYRVNAERFHSCAIELSKIYEYLDSDFELYGSINKIPDYKKYAQKYHNIISKYNINHSYLDFQIHKACNVNEYNDINKFKAILIRLKYFFFIYFIFLCIIILPIVCGVLILFL